MQAPYQTLKVRYLGFREAVAGGGAIVCTIVVRQGPECPAGSRFSLAVRNTVLSGRDRATRKLSPKDLMNCNSGVSDMRERKAPHPGNVRQNRQQNTQQNTQQNPLEVTLVTDTGTSGPFRNLAQPLSIVLFRTGESNEQHIDPGRTAGHIDRVL
jgi:hypothetical protein